MKLFPTPVEMVPLERLYLNHNLRAVRDPSRAFVYTNFIASLDGRIALECPRTGTAVVPGEIANPRDWRLFEELAAQADVLLTTGRYVRQLARGDAQAILPLSEERAYQDLRDWRRARGLAAQPAVVVLSASLDIPLMEPLIGRHGRVYIATGSDADAARIGAIEAQGARVIVAGEGRRVRGQALIEALRGEGLNLIYSTAGPKVLATLLSDRVLDRLYLTQVHRVLGSESYDTLVEGQRLDPPADVQLHSLYYDAPGEASPGQLFASYAVTPLPEVLWKGAEGE